MVNPIAMHLWTRPSWLTRRLDSDTYRNVREVHSEPGNYTASILDHVFPVQILNAAATSD